jgi:tetratricopeptide (TPR) repeat protein
MFNSFSSYCQIEFLDFKKYNDCQIEIPIRHSRIAQESDKKVADELKGTELIIIDAKKDGKIKKFYRGYIGVYSESDRMATFFEPIESIISFDKRHTVYLLYNSKNTYCYDAICFDKKYGIDIKNEEFRCSPKVEESQQFYGNGELAMRSEKYELAIKWFELSIKRDTTFCDAWIQLGKAYFMSGNHNNSYWSYINSLVIDSTYSLPWINLYELFIFNGDTANASQSLMKLQDNADKTEYDFSKYNGLYLDLKLDTD